MKKILGVLILLILTIPVFALAQTQTTTPAANGCSGDSITSCVNQIYIWSMAAAAILALLMIVAGGYITLTAAGNADRASKGKSYITSSIVGLVLLFGAYLLLRTINPDLVDFSNNCINNLNACTSQTSQPPATQVPANTNPQ